MNELFELTESTPPKLTQLRQAYENARAAYDEALAQGKVPAEIKFTLMKAGQELMEEEQREIKHS